MFRNLELLPSKREYFRAYRRGRILLCLVSVIRHAKRSITLRDWGRDVTLKLKVVSPASLSSLTPHPPRGGELPGNVGLIGRKIVQFRACWSLDRIH
jgi:hypothetical protein